MREIEMAVGQVCGGSMDVYIKPHNGQEDGIHQGRQMEERERG